MKRRVFVIISVILVLLGGCGGAGLREVQAESSVVRFVQITDTHLGQTAHQVTIAEKVIGAVKKSSQPLDFVVHTGDIVDDGKYKECLEAYQRIFSGLAMPFYPVAGNNDFDFHGRRKVPAKRVQECIANWKQHIGPFWEFADFEGVRAVMVSTELLIGGLEDGTELFAWLEEVLSEAKQEGRDVILFTHAPIVGSMQNGRFYSPYPKDVYQRLETLLNTYEVKAVIAGHFHVSGLYRCGDVPVYISAASQRGGTMQGFYRLYEYDPNTDRLTYDTIVVR